MAVTSPSCPSPMRTGPAVRPGSGVRLPWSSPAPGCARRGHRDRRSRRLCGVDGSRPSGTPPARPGRGAHRRLRRRIGPPPGPSGGVRPDPLDAVRDALARILPARPHTGEQRGALNVWLTARRAAVQTAPPRRHRRADTAAPTPPRRHRRADTAAPTPPRRHRRADTAAPHGSTAPTVPRATATRVRARQLKTAEHERVIRASVTSRRRTCSNRPVPAGPGRHRAAARTLPQRGPPSPCPPAPRIPASSGRTVRLRPPPPHQRPNRPRDRTLPQALHRPTALPTAGRPASTT
jgi:hypothetical protein